MNIAFCHTPVLWHSSFLLSEKRTVVQQNYPQIHKNCISHSDMRILQVKIKLSGSMLQPGWWEQLLLLTFHTWRSKGSLWSLKCGSRWQGCCWGTAGKDRRETKSELGQQEPTAPANPTYLARIVLGDGGLSQPWVSLPATVLTSVQSSATN